MTTQVIEETVASNPCRPIIEPSTRTDIQPTSIPLPEIVNAVLGAKEAPSKGFIVVLDSEKDIVGKPVRFGHWTDKEIETEENEDTSNDGSDGATDDNSTVDGEAKEPCKGDKSEGPLLEDITGGDENKSPLWLGLKVYMQFEDTLGRNSVTIGSVVREED
ncbi:hypothetical protein CPB83DRAFT_852445, partial [Crepidotus variabilis]